MQHVYAPGIELSWICIGEFGLHGQSLREVPVKMFLIFSSIRKTAPQPFEDAQVKCFDHGMEVSWISAMIRQIAKPTGCGRNVFCIRVCLCHPFYMQWLGRVKLTSIIILHSAWMFYLLPCIIEMTSVCTSTVQLLRHVLECQSPCFLNRASRTTCLPAFQQCCPPSSGSPTL